MQIDNVERGIVPFKNKTKTKCTKMTDESNLIKNGINGASTTSVTTNDKRVNISGEKVFCGETGGNVNSIRKKCGLTPMPGEQDDCQPASNASWNLSSVSENSSAVSGADVQTSQQGIGGRLQFFKDGKFILELARTREGEKEGWVSVPRKAFWPLSTSTIIYPKNESSASLSFSDDNSSIQSSPWQRDHCWKQATPRKNISKEMCLIFKRTKNFTFTKNGYKMAQIKKRKPYDTSICKMPFNFLNGFTKVKNDDEVDSKDVKLEKTDTGRNLNGNEKTCKTRAKLTDIIQKLIDKLPTGLFYLSKTAIVGGTVHHFSSTPSRIAELHHPQQHVSPRKRILREFEKVSLEDSSNKRCRAKNSSGFSTASTTTVVSQTVNVSSQCPVTSNVTRSGQISNGTSSTEQNATVSTPSRLYSSYSIHSLLGNACSSKTENKDTNSSQHPREMNDPSYLRLMLASSKTQDSNKSSSSAFTNHIKKSPTYSSYYDSNNHSKSPSRDLEHNSSRFKSIGSIAVSNSTSFHPYLSSPKYTSPSNPLVNAPNDSYKIRSARTSGSPNHQINVPTNRRSSPHSAFTQSLQSSSNVRYSSQTSPNSSRARDIPCSGNISPKLDRREGMPRTVPKKAATLRQQFSVPSSSPSTSQVESTLSHISASEQKKKCVDDRTVSPEQLYHPSVELDHNIGGVLRSSAIPPSALYYMYPRHGSPSAHTSPSYIPPVSYYNPYAAAVAALRNPLWMHYQAGVVPAAGTPSRLGPAMFPYNGASPGPPSIPSPLSSIHLPTTTLSPWTPSNQQTLSTEDPVSLANKKDEQSSDAPLNLSKH